MFVWIKSILSLFFQATKQIEENVIEKTNGALSEVIVSLKYLIQQLKE